MTPVQRRDLDWDLCLLACQPLLSCQDARVRCPGSTGGCSGVRRPPYNFRRGRYYLGAYFGITFIPPPRHPLISNAFRLFLATVPIQRHGVLRNYVGLGDDDALCQRV